MAKLDANGNRIRTYAYWPGMDQPHSTRTWEGGQNGAIHDYAPDLPTANVRGLFNASGTVTHRYEYAPYGEVLSASGWPSNPLRFAARELDEAAGLYYVRARWYDPVLGRFISEDPIGLAGGINNYAYALNDPVNLSDPTGSCVRFKKVNGKLICVLEDLVVTTRSRPWHKGFFTSGSDFGGRGRSSTFGGFTIGGEECTRSEPGNKFSSCVADLVPAELWDAVKTRIESIHVGIPECAGAKSALLALWNQGRVAGGIKFWQGRDYQYNRDGTPRYLRPGWRATIFGNHDGIGVLYDGAEFWTNRRLPVHEGLHRYLYLTGDSRNNDTYVHSVDGLCPAR